MIELSEDQFVEALNSADELGMVLRSHLHIEHKLEVFIKSAAPNYSKYEKQLNLEYNSKVLLSCALGLSDSLRGPLQAVGQLRNRFAHKPNFALTSSIVKAVYATFSEPHKQQLRIAYSEVAKRTKRTEKQYDQLSAEGQLGIIFMFLRSKMKLAIEQLTQ